MEKKKIKLNWNQNSREWNGIVMEIFGRKSQRNMRCKWNKNVFDESSGNKLEWNGMELKWKKFSDQVHMIMLLKWGWSRQKMTNRADENFDIMDILSKK